MLRKFINRIVAVFFAISLSVLMLTGCEAARKDDDSIVLRWVTYQASDVPLDIKEVVEAANAVSKEKIGVTVKLEFQPSDKLNLMMASGEYYDMVFTSSWVNPFDKGASAGLYRDVTDLVKTETPALYDYIDPFWDAGTVNGRIYGIPLLKDMGAEEMFRINSDYFEGKKGMVIPERMNFEDIEPFLKAYKEDFPGRYPLDMTRGGIPGYMNSVERVVQTLVVLPFGEGHEASNVIPFYECDQLMDRFRLLHKWYKAGYIHPDAATIESTTSDKSIPVRFGVAWKGYQGYSNPENWGFNVKTSIYEGPFLSRSSEQGAMIGICAACDDEHTKACLKYLELLSTDKKFRDILAYGIEGKHFEYLENGTVLRTDTGLSRYNTSLYQTGAAAAASVESVSRTFLADPDQWKGVFEEYETDGIYSAINGFAYDQARKEDIIAALNAIYSDYKTELITGTSDPDKVLPVIKKRMEEAGMKELVEDVRQQLEEWKKLNHE
ncbi:ABC transporter substrate-binding protein [Oribacterium sp. NK2B42]|uniref:ABC transporter substrate-binding protein n=1 Tax=Oribacterium sp. NK2B42 TaxID=689781 RepID=UPI00040D03AB|nr:ABC transporter substrate-binding protein [Oribacterium sp. NK2B42]